jgi:hypothetical protein
MHQSFFFEGKSIHRINQVHQDLKYFIQVGSSLFKYSKFQLALLSNEALKHFHHSELPFEINLPNRSYVQIYFGLNDLVSCFKTIDSLFQSETEIF